METEINSEGPSGNRPSRSNPLDFLSDQDQGMSLKKESEEKGDIEDTGEEKNSVAPLSKHTGEENTELEVPQESGNKPNFIQFNADSRSLPPGPEEGNLITFPAPGSANVSQIPTGDERTAVDFTNPGDQMSCEEDKTNLSILATDRGGRSDRLGPNLQRCDIRPPESTQAVQDETAVDPRVGSNSFKEQEDIGLQHNFLFPASAKRKAFATIGIGCLGSILGILGHHFFSSYLDGRDVGQHSQFWIKNAGNAFSQLVVLCMGSVITFLTLQRAWYSVSIQSFRISAMDELFSLPSPKAIAFLIGKYWTANLLFPISLALLVQSLVIVSTLAPNSLGVQPSKWKNATILIPNFDQGLIVPNQFQDDVDWLSHIMANPIENTWIPPTGCESACSIDVKYQAPALTCRKIRQDEIFLFPTYPTDQVLWNYTEIDGPSDHSATVVLNYITNNSNPDGSALLEGSDTSEIDGIYCEFLEGSFLANFGYANGLRSVKTNLISTMNTSSGCEQTQGFTLCEPNSNNLDTWNPNFIRNTVAPSSFAGSVPLTHFDGSVVITEEMGGGDLLPPFKQLINSIGPERTDTCELCQGFQTMFFNLTLAALLSIKETENGTGLVWDGENVWSYSQEALWFSYGPPLLVLLILAMYGAVFTSNRQTVVQNNFSNFFISTRTRQLEPVYVNDHKFKQQELRLDHRRGHFVERIARSSNYDDTRRSEPTDLGSSSPLPRQERNQVSQILQPINIKSDRWAMPITIAAFVVAIILAVGHYFFLSALNGHSISRYSQTWMRNISNGFSQGITLCLGLVVAYTFNQAAWRAIRLRSSHMKIIDLFFSAPTPLAMLSLLGAARNESAIYATIVALSAYALVLVTIVAPNSFTVGPGSPTSTQFIIPKLDLGQTVFPMLPWLLNHPYADPYNFYIASEGVPLNQLWVPPLGCGSDCSFEFEYEAPALSCVNSEQPYYFSSQISTPLNDGDAITLWTFLRTDYVLSDHNVTWGSSNSFNFYFEYYPGLLLAKNGSIPVFTPDGQSGSVSCSFLDATYQGSFQYTNSTMSISSTPLYNNNSYSRECVWDQVASLSDECRHYADASLRICSQAGQNALGGDGSRPFDYPNGTGFLASLFDYQNNIVEGSGLASLTIRTTDFDLGHAFMNIISYYTLAMTPYGPENMTVNGSVWGGTVWKFDAATLGYIYGTTFLWMLAILIYGLYCIHDNGMPLDKNFSTIMLATRTEEMQEAYDAQPDYDSLMKLKLQHERKGRFVVDGGAEYQALKKEE